MADIARKEIDMQIINGHLVVRFYSPVDYWIVDGEHRVYSLIFLARACGLSVSALEEVLE